MSIYGSVISDPHFLNDLRDEGLSARQIANRHGVGKTFVLKRRRALREEPQTMLSVAPGGDVSAVDQRTVTTEGSDGSRSVEGGIRHREITLEDARQWISATGDNPDDYNLSIRSIAYGKDQWSNRMSATPKPGRKIETAESDLDLPLLYSEATRLLEPETIAPYVGTKSLVVVWADVQVGKTGSRGGTPELITRVHDKLEKLKAHIVTTGASDAYFLSVGDEVESFENTPQQAFTNDLSFPQQLDLELTFELEFVRALAETHHSVTVSGVSSNHCRWRAGKNALGKPSDDYGIYLKHQLEKALRLNSDYDHVGFHYPEDWDETTAVDVQGTIVGMAHGHQTNRPDGIELWWTKQAFGKQAIANADILLTGHFHTARVQAVGERWWLQAPTLDNGSDWYRQTSGSDSQPGLMVFTVDENGFDLSSLTIL